MSIASLKNALETPLTVTENGKSVTYHGFNVYVISLELGTSVSLRVNAAYLEQGGLNNKALNDGTYNYKAFSVTLSDADYTKWGSDDNYIVDYVKSKLSTIVTDPQNTFRPFFGGPRGPPGPEGPGGRLGGPGGRPEGPGGRFGGPGGRFGGPGGRFGGRFGPQI